MEVPSPAAAVGAARIHQEWARRVQAEYRSAAIAARTVHLAIACGLPEGLVRTGLRVVGDELDHARLSQDTLVALGGADHPQELDVAELIGAPLAPDHGPLAALVDLAVRSFCLGETFAVPLFRAMRAQTTHPAARATLDRVLRDEAVHRTYGWDLLDAVLDVDGLGVRARVRARLPGWLAAYARAYRPEPALIAAASPLGAEERGAGLLDLRGYAAIHDACLQDDVLPRLAERGLSP
ncbi:MAG: ferritin-like domain-containing protein [Alphaproteobacteria bacterium]|nr:ferritin-like domain-containing protein [Alphaproteobacteria bacterium]